MDKYSGAESNHTTEASYYAEASAFDVSRVIESEWQFLLEVEFFYFSLIVPLYINVKEDCYH